MGKKSAPPAPDYSAAAAQTAASNNQQLNYQTWANRPTISTPWGTSSWSATAGTDPSSGLPITNWTNNISLSPEQQQALSAQQAITSGRSLGALGLLDQAANAFNSPVNYQGAPQLFSWGGPASLNTSGGPSSAGLRTNPFDPMSRANIQTPMSSGGASGSFLPNPSNVGGASSLPAGQGGSKSQPPTGPGASTGTGTGTSPGASTGTGTGQTGTTPQTTGNMYGPGGPFPYGLNPDGTPRTGPSTTTPPPTTGGIDPSYGGQWPTAEPGLAQTDKISIEPSQQMRASGGQSFAGDMAPQSQATGANPQSGMDFFSNAATQAIQQRQQPMMDRRRAQLENQLSNMGMARGSEAWNNAMQDLGRQENDANLAAITAGINQGNVAFGQGMDVARFGNTAQQQEYENAMRAYGQGNQAQLQQQQAMSNFGNYQQALRSQWLQEQAARRGMPLNELNALLSGTQVSQPSFGGPNSTAGQGQGVNYLGAAQMQYGAGLDQFNIGQAQNQGWMNGLGSAAQLFAFSDVRLKENIKPVGRLNDGTRLFSWNWKDDGAPGMGVIAQDVESRDPDLVATHQSGNKMVDYANLLRKQVH